jgi:hypothetical protein
MLRIFNALQGSGRQIVMASDRPPSEIADVDERLVTRLAGGLIVDISLPEYETRVAILRNKCAEGEMTFATGVLEELAKLPCGSVRELQGALNRLAAHEALGDSSRDSAECPRDRRRRGGRDTGVRARDACRRVERRVRGLLSRTSPSRSRSTSKAGASRLGERVAHWQRSGYSTAMLDRALALNEEVDVGRARCGVRERRGPPREARGSGRSCSIRGSPASMSSGTRSELPRPKRVSSRQSRRTIHRRRRGPRSPSRRSLPESRTAGAACGGSGKSKRPARATTRCSCMGGTGVGKTHLVHAVGNALRRNAALSGPVACVSGSQFVDELIDALQGGTEDRWRARYRAAGALIVDDVHTLAGKRAVAGGAFPPVQRAAQRGAPGGAGRAIGHRRRSESSRRDSAPASTAGSLSRFSRPTVRSGRRFTRASWSTAAPAPNPAWLVCSPNFQCLEPPKWNRSSTRVMHSARSSGGHVTMSLVRRELHAGGAADARIRAGNRGQVVPRRREGS